jgi:hypothetical protein
VAELTEHWCPRCGRPFPIADDDYAAAADWVILVDGDVICPGRATPLDRLTEER